MLLLCLKYWALRENLKSKFPMELFFANHMSYPANKSESNIYTVQT